MDAGLLKKGQANIRTKLEESNEILDVHEQYTYSEMEKEIIEQRSLHCTSEVYEEASPSPPTPPLPLTA